MVLIDHDRFTAANLLSQAVTSRAVGRAKARVMAALARRINPTIVVRAVVRKVEDMPLGTLRADLIAACLDSLSARQHVAEASWRLGVPLVDAGVQADGLLARVDVYVPGEQNACMECGWDRSDYDRLEVSYPCKGGEVRPTPTGATSSLGALAASLQAIECERLIAGGPLDLGASARRVVIDARHHKLYPTVIRRNAACRVTDHRIWKIDALAPRSGHLTLADLLGLDGRPFNGAAGDLFVDGVPFVVGLTCVRCGTGRWPLRLRSSLAKRDLTCSCGGEMVASGFDQVERLNIASLPDDVHGWPLARLGVRPGDVVSISCSGTVRHYLMPEAI
jgi:molybdopterin/thiamine biosynthesis adenylyltransferase